MRLRQIKLAGFKSFADPTLIELRHPFVGIVGPNGCGKSNVIDAVRWVLGEGRVSELRGSSSMSELIFAGSTSRAQMGRASVELVLDNKDGTIKGPWGQYAELSIRRIVSRDGLSNYFINGLQVRRRDVQEIFLGTGLGARSYAIISQGMIASFIKAKPEELRVYLEEAAGVSLYKERRRETENLLRQTAENLDRASDLQTIKADEIERLRSEAETAKTWKTLTEKKEESESLWYFLQYEEAKREHDETRAAIECAQNELTEKKEAYDESQAQYEELNAVLLTAEAERANADQAYHEAEKELARHEGEMARIVEKRRRAEIQLKSALEALEVKRAQLEGARIEREELAAAVEECRAALEILDEEALAREENTATAEVDEAQTKAEADNAARLLKDARGAMQREEAELAKERGRLEELEYRAKSFESDEALGERPDPEKLKELQALFEEAQTESEEAQTATQEASAALEDARARARTATEAYFSILSELKANRGKLEALEDIKAQSAAPEAFAQWLDETGLGGIPELSEAVTVSPDWVVAFEAVLEHRARAFLLRDLRTAASFENNRPPARLAFAAPKEGITLPQTRCKEKPDNESAREIILTDGTKLPALLSYVETDEKAVSDVLHDWLSRVGVVSDLKNAMACRERLPEGGSLVTPAGDILTKSSLVYWTADDPGLAVFSRKQSIKRLKDIVEALEDKSGIADDERQTASKAEVRAREVFECARRREADVNNRARKAEIACRDEATAAAAFARREADWKLSKEALEASLAEQRAVVAEAFGRVDALSENLEEAEAAMAEASGKSNRASERLAQLRRDEATARHEAGLKRLTLNQTRSQLGKTAARIEELKRDIEREEAREKDARAELAEDKETALEAGTSELLLKVEALEAKMREATEKVSAAKAKVDANAKIARELQVQLMPLSESIGTMRVTAEQKSALLDQFSERLDELGADWTAMAVLAQKRRVKASTVRNEVMRLMNEIAALGPVNHAALMHLEEAERSMAETKAQINDLRQASETLEAAIRKIDAETRLRMRETFKRVNENFEETFKGLFGGGHAQLQMRGDEILQAGVEVIAQPPGKRNASVKLLSGGEQALTATALVFAMFKLNPAPFCLLDEVDAPLDEANQGRLAQLCLKMSEATQFLIITHHRVTMEYTSALIGVTMKEPGVSRVVSVDIDEAIRYANDGKAETKSADRAV